MPYDPQMVQPMKEELTQHGVQELLTADDVDSFMEEAKSGTALVIVNSVCGCAAGGARPGVIMALRHEIRPDRVVTVFAGQDVEATAAMRAKLSDYPPSSPSVALMKDGKVVHFLHRHDIEGRDAQAVAWGLVEAFDKYCSTSDAAS